MNARPRTPKGNMLNHTHWIWGKIFFNLSLSPISSVSKKQIYTDKPKITCDIKTIEPKIRRKMDELSKLSLVLLV